MLNKAARIAGIIGNSTKPDFYHRKRTQPSSQFNEYPPAGRWYMSQHNPGIAKRKQSTKNDETDKQEMENKNGVG